MSISKKPRDVLGRMVDWPVAIASVLLGVSAAYVYLTTGLRERRRNPIRLRSRLAVLLAGWVGYTRRLVHRTPRLRVWQPSRRDRKS